nr:MAG TPA: hypothetical protein [Caudoviricetes sp.]
MKNYTDEQLLNRVKGLKSFIRIPNDYWILGVQSKDDKFNEFDDKFYLFKGEKFIMVTTGTTNAGLTGLKHYDTYNPNGCAVIKTDEWYYTLWRPGLHKGKMRALKQYSAIKYYRDWNKNDKAEEIGNINEGVIGINFHTASYQPYNVVTRLIGGWSTGCQVANNTADYYKILDYIGNQDVVSYCLIKEF